MICIISGNSEVAIVGNYKICNVINEVSYILDMPLKLWQPTSKPGRPQLKLYYKYNEA